MITDTVENLKNYLKDETEWYEGLEETLNNGKLKEAKYIAYLKQEIPKHKAKAEILRKAIEAVVR